MIGLLLALVLRLPNPALTPGVARPLSNAEVCSTKWGKDRRHVTEAMKREVARRYGIRRASVVAAGKGPCCEWDHVIPRELGGADDVANIWAQPWREAHQKDRLENALKKLVCSGSLPLQEAQEAIRSDWISAYKKYVVDVAPRLPKLWNVITVIAALHGTISDGTGRTR